MRVKAELRDNNVPLYVIKNLNKAPANHFELTRPYRPGGISWKHG
jgi:hypothetical protein